MVDLSKNQLSSLQDMAALISAAPLRELDLRANEVSESRQELDSIIVASPTIQLINGRDLMKSERPYLQQLHRLGARQPLDHAVDHGAVDELPVGGVGTWAMA